MLLFFFCGAGWERRMFLIADAKRRAPAPTVARVRMYFGKKVLFYPSIALPGVTYLSDQVLDKAPEMEPGSVKVRG